MTQSVRYLAAVATATVWMLAPGCGADDGAKDPETAGAGSWDALPTGPLTPREGALALWSGREVLLIGGSDAPPCPPTAEVSAVPHTGCAKFRARFGSDALKLVNKSPGRELRLRGLNARVVRPGTVRVGDAIVRL
jgi:hypothetical protein